MYKGLRASDEQIQLEAHRKRMLYFPEVDMRVSIEENDSRIHLHTLTHTHNLKIEWIENEEL